MKKQFLLLLSGVFISASSLFAQQPPNNGFETWTSTDNPDDWTTVASTLGPPYASLAAPLAIKDNADFIEGAASIKLTSTSIPTMGIAPGMVGLGTLNTSTYQFSGIPFSGRPDTLFWAYKYEPAIPEDSALLQVIFSSGGSPVAGGAIPLPARSTWGLFGIAIDNWSIPGNPDNMRLEFYSSTGTPALAAGSVLNVDAVFFTYAPQTTTPTVSVVADQPTVPESIGTTTFTATLSEAATSTITVPVTFSGTATNGADYTVAPNSFTFNTGDITSTITVTVVDDTDQEPSETIIATLGTPTGATLGTPSSATITITDNDAVPGLPDLTISASPVSIPENGGTSVITVTLSEAAASTVSADINFTGTATQGADYTVSGTSISIPAGSLSATVDISATDDALVEGNETLIAALSNVSGANIGTLSSVTITIIDDDVAPTNPTLTITAQPTSVSEAGGTANFTATLSEAVSGTVTATVNFGGTATSGTDYTASGTTISIPAGSLSASISISVIDDALVEGNETVTATLVNVQGADLGSPSSATLTIIDNDGSTDVPTVSLSVSNTSVSEVSGAITLTATLSQPAATQVIVGVNFAGTAITPDDFTVTGNTFVIAPGATSASITITIIDDAIYEGTETIFVSINSLSGAILGQPASVSITIADNDVAGINESETLRAINVYPNPARDVLKVAMGSAETQFVNLVNIQGKIVKQATVVSGENVLDISDVNSGNYVLTFTNAETKQFSGAKPVTVAK